MPLFAEFVRLDQVQQRSDAELAALSLPLLRKYLARRPRSNPVSLFLPVFLRDVEQLKVEGMAAYHAYAFASLRQLGAGFSLGAHYLRWLQQHQNLQFVQAAAEFEAISEITKTLLLKTARAVMGKKAVDLAPLVTQLAAHWQQGMNELDLALQAVAHP